VFGEISTKSNSASFARSIPSVKLTTPNCSPSAPISLISSDLIKLLILNPFLECLISMSP